MRTTTHCSVRIALVFTVGISHAQNYVSNPPPPPPPAKIAVPELTASQAEPYCIDCAPFDTQTHKKILNGLVGNVYIGELRKALYMQDGVHQFQSKAHFDNCDFDDSIKYVNELLADVGKKVELAQAFVNSNDKKALRDNLEFQSKMKEAFFALGQALHGVQDFYAHSNYLEMQVGAAKKASDLQSVQVWTSSGIDFVQTLSKNNGLKSGYVFWGTPQKCPVKSPSHAELNKDSEDSPSGKVRVAHLKNNSQYTLAQFLAKRTSIELVSYAFKKWPLLKEANGEVVAFEVLVDHRGLR